MFAAGGIGAAQSFGQNPLLRQWGGPKEQRPFSDYLTQFERTTVVLCKADTVETKLALLLVCLVDDLQKRVIRDQLIYEQDNPSATGNQKWTHTIEFIKRNAIQEAAPHRR